MYFIFSVHGFDSDNFFDIYENPDDLDDSSPCEDDDDSNDEGNWRNDYPDEDETDNRYILNTFANYVFNFSFIGFNLTRVVCISGYHHLLFHETSFWRD